MTRIAFIACLFTTMLIGNVSAADSQVKFIATMTGVTWGGCKTHVREAFSKLDGVSNVEIAAGDKPGTQKVTVTGSKDGISKTDAVKSLGDYASKYVVVDWKKQ